MPLFFVRPSENCRQFAVENHSLTEMCYALMCVREVGVAGGRANQWNKPTVGDRPRAPSPPAVTTAPHTHDVQIHHQQNDDDDDDDDDDDWDEVRSVISCCILHAASDRASSSSVEV